jgi:sec-independent protein translocase protein TatC
MSELYPPESQSMGLVGHLDELRRRILICLVFFLAVVVCLFSQGYVLLDLLEAPARGAITGFIFTAPTEAFSTYFTVVLLAAFIVCFPVVLFQLWAFVAPAMPRASRRFVIAWFTFALVSFLGGIAFAYAVLLPSAFNFLVGFGEGIAKPMISLSQYMSFAVTIIFIGGIVFEIPFIIGMLTEAGVLQSRILRAGRRYAMFIIVVLAAVLTPTQDVFNMLLFAVPMAVLYEVGILLSFWVETRKAKIKNS